MECDKSDPGCYTINKGRVQQLQQQQQQQQQQLKDKFSDYSGNATRPSGHEEYAQGQGDEAGGLYSVSQRVPTVSASYSSLCPDAPYGAEWERTTSTETKDTASSDALSEKQTAETNTNSSGSSGPSSVISSAALPVQERLIPVQEPLLPTCIYLHNNSAVMVDMDDPTAPSADTLMMGMLSSEELALNKQVAVQVFSLWMCSPLLQLQLKPTHKPYEIRRAWKSLLAQYSHCTSHKQLWDEPIISFQRNVFFPQHLEEKIKDQKCLELLYEEAKNNILEGRYPCEVSHYIMLGGIQARIELGPYNPQVHSTHYFREEQCKYLPVHVRKSATWTWLPISSKNSAEVRLLEQFKRIPVSATNRKIMRKYLEFCWSLPFYGSAFFEGQVEQPVRGLMSLMTHQDIPVLVAVNSKGVYVIDDLQCTVLIGLKYEEFSWDFARPSREDDPNCLPCLFLQFMIVENGARVSKILQVFSKQAALIDNLIAGFVHQLKEKPSEENDRQSAYHIPTDNTDNPMQNTLSHTHAGLSSLSNKLSKLTLATFDDEGHCIGQMGSWSFSY